MNTLTIAGLVFTSFMILLALFVYTGKRLSQKEEIDAKESKDTTTLELRDVAIILQNGTLYESYQGVLLTHFSDRIYHLHAMNGTKKELVARLHLGEGMMLKVVVAGK